MHTEPNAHGRSYDARQAARAQLQALRAARRARRGGGAPSGISNAPEEAAVSEAQAEGLRDIPEETAEDLTQEPPQDTDALAVDPVEEDEGLAEDPADDIDFVEPDPVPDEPPHDAPEEPAAATEDATKELDGPEQALLPDDDSPLFQLPGAGPGLVWMLNRAGVTTLEELANADPEALKAEFGVVGQILDLDFWIDWARSPH